MENFNLEEYLANPNRKVVTRDGRPVRVVCWDKLGDCPIIACIKYSDNYEDLGTYNIDGLRYYPSREDPSDLFFADEEDELTEFELRLLSSLNYTRKYRQDFSDEDMLKIIKDTATELLDLARKEILKDLPKWKKATNDREFNKHILLFEDEKRVVLTTELYKGEYYIEVDDLETLPKEE